MYDLYDDDGGDDSPPLLSLQANGSIVTSLLASLTSHATPDAWFTYPSQQSAPLPLQAGQQVLLESYHCNNQGPGFQQVSQSGAWVPASESDRVEV